MKQVRLIVVLFWLMLSVPAGAGVDFSRVDPADYAFDAWYLETINGQPCGYSRLSMVVGEAQIVSTFLQHTVEMHGGERMESSLKVVWHETLAFEPLYVTVESRDGAEAVTQTYRFEEGVGGPISIESRQGERTTATVHAEPLGAFLTAAQFVIALDEALKAGGDGFELTTWDPQVGMVPYTVAYSRPEAAALALLDGKELEATRWEVRYSFLPDLPTREYVGADRRTLSILMDYGGLVTQSYLADASVAEMAFDPPEMSGLSVVVPDRAIDQPLRVHKGVYELSFGDGEGEVEILPPTTRHQAVERLDGRRVRVTVDLDRALVPGREDLPKDEHLAATIAVDHKDPVIRGLAARVADRVGGDASVLELAQASRRFVSGYVDGATLSVGSATASEVARSKAGDCTECSVLLAAMLRAQGIPSRCVTGLVYSADAFVGQSDVFVYHMWTQAWVADDTEAGGCWVDLDAAMWRYTATHIALGVSSMGEDAAAELMKLVPMMADLKIRVQETSR